MDKLAKICVVFCLTVAMALAEGQTCYPPEMTSGYLWVTATAGVMKAAGPFTYDFVGNRLRLSIDGHRVSNFTYPDQLFLFEQGYFYEFNNDTRTCKKRPLFSKVHPMKVQPNMTYTGEIVVESRNGSDHGVGMVSWVMDVPLHNGFLVVSTCNLSCLTLSSMLYTQSKEMLFFSFFEVGDVKDPAVFEPPEFCEGVPEEPLGNEFLNIFLGMENHTRESHVD